MAVGLGTVSGPRDYRVKPASILLDTVLSLLQSEKIRVIFTNFL